MKYLRHNEDNINDSEVTDLVKRVKILLINSKNEILLGNSFNTFQFPGGHVEENESLADTLKRELLEETGISLENLDLEPFACAEYYYKDYPLPGEIRKNEIYYFEVKTDEIPRLNKTEYTKEEIDGHFKLCYINLKNVEQLLNDNCKKYGNRKGIATEMLDLLKIYKENI